jgi:hypothetical protein
LKGLFRGIAAERAVHIKERFEFESGNAVVHIPDQCSFHLLDDDAAGVSYETSPDFHLRANAITK